MVQGREFREADNSVSMPGSDKPSTSASPDALYADQVQQSMVSRPRHGRGFIPRRCRTLWLQLRSAWSWLSLIAVIPLSAWTSPHLLLPSAPCPAPQPARKSNLSKEMKAKLRAEYTGWGGAENKVSACLGKNVASQNSFKS